MADFIDLTGSIDSISNASVVVNYAQCINLIANSDSISNVLGTIKFTQHFDLTVSINSLSNTLGIIDLVEADEVAFRGNFVYTKTLDQLLSGVINCGTASFKVMLLNSNYEPKVTHEYQDIILYGAEIVAEGYIAGGQAVTNVLVSNGKLRGDNLFWRNVTFDSVRFALLYIDNGAPSTNIALGVFDFGYSRSVEAETFAVLWGITGGNYGTMIQLLQKVVPVSQNFITA